MLVSFFHAGHVIAYCIYLLSFFFFNDTATTEIYTLSLHDALPISISNPSRCRPKRPFSLSIRPRRRRPAPTRIWPTRRSEEHTSELQSLAYLVCRLLLEKKNQEGRALASGDYILHVFLITMAVEQW